MNDGFLMKLTWANKVVQREQQVLINEYYSC